jgi:hypothetical protein
MNEGCAKRLGNLWFADCTGHEPINEDLAGPLQIRQITHDHSGVIIGPILLGHGLVSQTMKCTPGCMIRLSFGHP